VTSVSRTPNSDDGAMAVDERAYHITISLGMVATPAAPTTAVPAAAVTAVNYHVQQQQPTIGSIIVPAAVQQLIAAAVTAPRPPCRDYNGLFCNTHCFVTHTVL